MAVERTVRFGTVAKIELHFQSQSTKRERWVSIRKRTAGFMAEIHTHNGYRLISRRIKDRKSAIIWLRKAQQEHFDQKYVLVGITTTRLRPRDDGDDDEEDS